MIKIKDLEYETLGDKLKGHRLDKGLTQAELAIKTGIERATIANYETGRSEPSLKKFLKICQALDITQLNLI
ncbi:MAG: helix-turn-helix domain-containing protein [Ginsengibacter sp.]